jgi:hypothetical protein
MPTRKPLPVTRGSVYRLVSGRVARVIACTRKRARCELLERPDALTATVQDFAVPLLLRAVRMPSMLGALSVERG